MNRVSGLLYWRSFRTDPLENHNVKSSTYCGPVFFVPPYHDEGSEEVSRRAKELW
jgi:hypothetical protein